MVATIVKAAGQAALSALKAAGLIAVVEGTTTGIKAAKNGQTLADAEFGPVAEKVMELDDRCNDVFDERDYKLMAPAALGKAFTSYYKALDYGSAFASKLVADKINDIVEKEAAKKLAKEQARMVTIVETPNAAAPAQQ